jgi:hypothetical protein
MLIGTTLMLIVNFTLPASLNCDFWNPSMAKRESEGREKDWPLPRNPTARRAGPTVVFTASANTSRALADTHEECPVCAPDAGGRSQPRDRALLVAAHQHIR